MPDDRARVRLRARDGRAHGDEEGAAYRYLLAGQAAGAETGVDEPAAPRNADQAVAERAPLFGGLPLNAGDDLVFLKTDGRYIQVYTTTDSSRGIARFADAVAQLGESGMQVHRSYWVARRHVTDLVKRVAQTCCVSPTGGKYR